MKRLTDGARRTVYLVGPWAFKVPIGRFGFTHWLRGWATNRNEAAWWRSYPSELLCPVLATFFFGMIVVMPRCHPVPIWMPIVYKRIQRIYKTKYGFSAPIECKASSFGMLNSRIVAVDYGVS